MKLYLVEYTSNNEWELAEGIMIVQASTKNRAENLARVKVGYDKDITGIRLLESKTEKVLFWRAEIIE